MRTLSLLLDFDEQYRRDLQQDRAFVHRRDRCLAGEEISSAGRTPQFERRYASVTRVLPGPVRHLVDPAARPAPEDAFVELMRIAARAHGVGTEQCLRDYFRLSPSQARPALKSLIATGELRPVTIDGWRYSPAGSGSTGCAC